MKVVITYSTQLIEQIVDFFALKNNLNHSVRNIMNCWHYFELLKEK